MGVVSIDLANAGIDPLALAETYHWYFSIVPDATDRSNDVVVHGNIRRIYWANQLQQQLEAAITTEADMSVEESLTQTKALYQEADLWHDAALVLYTLRQTNPENMDVVAEWNRLLEFAELSNVVQSSTSFLQVGLR